MLSFGVLSRKKLALGKAGAGIGGPFAQADDRILLCKRSRERDRKLSYKIPTLLVLDKIVPQIKQKGTNALKA